MQPFHACNRHTVSCGCRASGGVRRRTAASGRCAALGASTSQHAARSPAASWQRTVPSRTHRGTPALHTHSLRNHVHVSHSLYTHSHGHCEHAYVPGTLKLRGPLHIALHPTQAYIDDVQGTALLDTVRPPPELLTIGIGASNTRGLGGVEAPDDSRLAVHARITIDSLRQAGFVDAPKTTAGDRSAGLGFRVTCPRYAVGTMPARDGGIDCPELKQRKLCDDAIAFRSSVARGGVSGRSVETWVGRLGHMSQIFPSLLMHMDYAYRVARAGTKTIKGRVTRTAPFVHIRGELANGFIQYCNAVLDEIGENNPRPLLPQACFPPPTSPLALIVVTDASGADGFGGFAYFASNPGRLLTFSEEWPARVKQALANAGASSALARNAPDGLKLSMPCAELFGAYAIGEAALHNFTELYETAEALAAAPDVTHIYSVGDCSPAAAAITSYASHSAQMRTFTRQLFQSAAHYVGVCVPREHNQVRACM